MRSSAVMGLAAAVSPLRSRGFRRAWGGQSLSAAGDRFHDVALAWLVLQLSGAFAALGVILAARAIAATALLLTGGLATDRFTARRLLLVSALARLGMVAAIAALVAWGRASIGLLVALEIGFGLAEAFSRPAESSIAPHLVPHPQLEAAAALTAASENVGRLVGPILAGAVVAGWGVAAAFSVDAASFGLALLLFTGIPDGLGATVGQWPPPDLVGGLRRALAAPAVRWVLLLWAVSCLGLSGPFLVGLPALARGRFGGGALTLGALLGAWGLGQLCGNLIGGARGRPRNPAGAVGAVTVVCGLAWMSLAADGGLVVALAMIATAGLADGIAEVVAPAWVQRVVEAAMLGRVMAGLELARSLPYPFSMLAAGALVGPAPAALFLISGLLLTGVGAACVLGRR